MNENNKMNKTTQEGAEESKKVDAKKGSDSKKSVKKEPKKVKVDYKKENKKLRDEINNLTSQLEVHRLENIVNLTSFQDKAKTFQDKAQLEINKFKGEYRDKLKLEMTKFKEYASQDLIESIIQPLMNIEIAIKAGKTRSSDVSAYVMGFEMLMNQLFIELATFGLAKIIPVIGQEFDPESHQAFSTGDGEKNKIIKINKNGFKLNDRVIQPAIVVIGK